MTEQRRKRRGPGPLPVILGSIATFLVVLVMLAVQVRAGHDPALGSGAQVATLGSGHKVVTRTSGSAASPAAHGKTTHPVTTRTSGGGESDDE
jgi:hypothetical protein